MPPKSTSAAPAAKPTSTNVVCVARGSSDLSDGFSQLDESRVQFMLVKFPVGAGTFKRNKFVYIHYIGPKCGLVKRGKWNAELGNVLALFNTSAGFETTEKESLTFESIVTKLQKVFVADDGKFSIKAVQDEFNRRIEEEKASLVRGDASEGGGGADEPTSPIRKRKLAVELGLKAESVLKAVREDMGPFNWCIFEPDAKTPKLIEGGSNGLFELIEQLKDDGIVFGLVRVAFGTGRFRRMKVIFFHWTGDAVGIVKRAKSNELHGAMLSLLGPANADIKLAGADDRAVSSILAKVQKTFVVDTINVEKSDRQKEQEAAFSQEQYLAALIEEQDKVKEFYNEPETAPAPAAKSGPTQFDVDETLNLVRQDAGGLLWAIFQCAS